jgi:hypothetical protein
MVAHIDKKKQYMVAYMTPGKHRAHYTMPQHKEQQEQKHNLMDAKRLWRNGERWMEKARRILKVKCQRLLVCPQEKLLLQSHLQHVAMRKCRRHMRQFQNSALVGFLHIAHKKGVIQFCGREKEKKWQTFRVVPKEKKTFVKGLLLLFGMQDPSTGERAHMGLHSDAWQTLQESFWDLGYVPGEDTRNIVDETQFHAVWSMAFSGEIDFVSF